MKKPLLFTFALLSTGLYAQEHFSGINTSRRTGIINANVNPAELVNLKSDHEVNVFTFSANVANNKISFGDIVGGIDNFEETLFSGDEAVRMRADIEILGPSFAFKYQKWGFAVTSAAKIKADIVDVNTGLGRALTTDVDGLGLIGEFVNSKDNQRVTGTSWGEIGLSAAREIYSDEEHSISGGLTFKLLFPGSYANMSAGAFTGQIRRGTGANINDAVLTDANANLNFAYSGSLADGFTDAGNFTDFFAGGLNGFATDIGFNYRWKDTQSSTNGYKINAGISFRNLGKMTFKDDNNVSNNYSLNIPDGQELSLSQFEDVDKIEEIEEILLESGYVTLNQTGKDFKVKLPAVFSIYADAKVYNNWYVTGFLQQKMNEDGNNDQVTIQNIFTVTPRYSGDWFEAYMPLSSNEISGFTAGIGVRLGGFYIGSGSVLSAVVSDTDQADAYLGFRFGF